VRDRPDDRRHREACGVVDGSDRGRDLFKSYGAVDAVRGISFRVEEGEVFALLGPNGAGKTTTLEILEGHRRRASASIRKQAATHSGTGSGSCCSPPASTAS
jgi:ABC-2 type transport system ATP-binding protein